MLVSGSALFQVPDQITTAKGKAATMTEQALMPVERITSLILTLREQRVILDSDLARIYQVPTKALNQAVKRK